MWKDYINEQSLGVHWDVDKHCLDPMSLGARRDIDEPWLGVRPDVDEHRLGIANLGDRKLLRGPGVLSSLSHPTYSGRRNSKINDRVQVDDSLWKSLANTLRLGRASNNYWGE